MRRPLCRSLLPALALLFAALPGSAQTLVERFNCGWAGTTVPTGEAFATDQPYVPGVSNGYVGGTPVFEVLSVNDGLLVGGDQHPWSALLEYGRLDWSAYRFDVPNGDYIVRVVLAETFNQGPGLRALNLTAEGFPLAADLDLAAEFGVQYAAVLAAEVSVDDGRLDVEAQPGPGVKAAEVEAPLIHAIEVFTAPAKDVPPAPVGGLEAQPSYGANLLYWDWNTSDPTVAAYAIERANSAAGPFSVSATIGAAPSRYIDRAAVSGQAHFYRVHAISFAGLSSPPSAVVSATSMESSASPLRVYDLQVAPADQLFIDENILLQPSEEVPAQFSFDGVSQQVETRYRGNAARLLSKKSWKVKFPASATFEGRTDLNLKASFIDETQIREDLAFGLHRAVAQLAPPAVDVVHLRVNDVYAGVFSDIEQIDERFLAARDRDTGATIYRCGGNLTPLAGPAEYAAAYEKETNASDGHDDLIELIDFLNGPIGPGYVRELADRVNLDAYLDYLAVVAWTSDQDTKSQNYFLIHDHELGRWEVVPWDPDSAFGLAPGTELKSIVAGTSLDPGGGVINQLRERVLLDDGLRWRFVEKLKEFESLYGNASFFGAAIDAAHLARVVDAIADPFKFGWESPARFLGSVSGLHQFIDTRAAIVQAEAPVYQPASAPTTLWINELTAGPQAVLADEMGDFDDWVELFNAGAADFDLSGAFLTDDLGAPTQWGFPPGTVVPAGGRLLVWCDGEPTEGPLHTNFRLSSLGEELGLVAADGSTLIDFASWGPQQGGVAHGRRIDGGALLAALPTPTPNAANTTAGNLPPRVTWVEHVPGSPDATQPVEVTCRATDADGVASVLLAWRTGGGGAFATLPMQPVGGERYAATLPVQPAGTLVEYFVGAIDTLGVSAVKPLEAPQELFGYLVVVLGGGPLRISEVLASNSSGLQDEAGEFEDWIEIENTSGASIDLGGMHLSDSLADPDKWSIPAGTVLPGGDSLVVFADDEPAEGPLHATFRLGAGGEEVGLFDARLALIDGFGFGPQTTDVSLGRLTATGERYRLFHPTPGAPNLPGNGGVYGYGPEDPALNTVNLASFLGVLPGFPWGTVVSGSVPSSPGVLIVGLQALAIPLGPDGVLLQLPFTPATVGFTTGTFGSASPSLEVPNNPGLSGLTIFAQAYVVGAGLSNGLVATIGP